MERDIDFEPIYQRKAGIWNITARQRLIDTVLNGFDIPKVYLADFTFSEKRLDRAGRPYAVIDGKQRLATLFSFFKGDLHLHKNFVFYDDPAIELGGMSYDRVLENYPEIAQRFSNFELTVMGVVTDDDKYINEMFLRLNANSSLTGAEKRSAMLGEVPKLISDIVRHDFFRRKVSFATLRGQDANTAAKLLLIEHADGPVDTKKVHLDRLVQDPGSVNKSALDSSRGSKFSTELAAFGDLIDGTKGADIAWSAQAVMVNLDRIAPLFLDGDKLLAAQGLIPVLYLVVRSIEDDDLRFIRPFLERFQWLRERNRALELLDEGRDPEISEYELLNRSSNDQNSIAGRFRILLKRFRQFVERGGADFRADQLF